MWHVRVCLTARQSKLTVLAALDTAEIAAEISYGAPHLAPAVSLDHIDLDWPRHTTTLNITDYPVRPVDVAATAASPGGIGDSVGEAALAHV